MLVTWMVIAIAPTFAQEQDEAKQINFISQIGCEVQFDLDYILSILANGVEMSDSLIGGDTTLISLKEDDERWFVTPDNGATIVSFKIDEEYAMSELLLREGFVWYYSEEGQDLYLDPFLYFVGDNGGIYRFPIFEFSNGFVVYYNDIYYHYDDNGRLLLLGLGEFEVDFWGELIDPVPSEREIFHLKLLDGDTQNYKLLLYLEWLRDDPD